MRSPLPLLVALPPRSVATLVLLLYLSLTYLVQVPDWDPAPALQPLFPTLNHNSATAAAVTAPVAFTRSALHLSPGRGGHPLAAAAGAGAVGGAAGAVATAGVAMAAARAQASGAQVTGAQMTGAQGAARQARIMKPMGGAGEGAGEGAGAAAGERAEAGELDRSGTGPDLGARRRVAALGRTAGEGIRRRALSAAQALSTAEALSPKAPEPAVPPSPSPSPPTIVRVSTYSARSAHSAIRHKSHTIRTVLTIHTVHRECCSSAGTVLFVSPLCPHQSIAVFASAGILRVRHGAVGPCVQRSRPRGQGHLWAPPPSEPPTIQPTPGPCANGLACGSRVFFSLHLIQTSRMACTVFDHHHR